ncbi:hypothetical protein N8267_02320 [Pelagibacteraceae bacterium]|nr:hypothetical protein [Pelagibacteraceae bacterium]
MIFTFILLEIISRAFFSELSNNHIHKTISETQVVSKSINVFYENFDGFVIRKSNKIYDKKINYDRVYLIGDSVSGGYGLKYVDTFFSIAEDMLNNSSLNKKRFLPIGNYNSNIFDNYDVINDNINKFSKDDYLMFQFNFNDLNFNNFRKYFTSNQYESDVLDKSEIPIINNLNREDKEFMSGNLDNYQSERLPDNIIYNLLTTLRNKTRLLRSKYLNHSSFLRVMQHYAGIFSRNTSGSCEHRKLDALGQYTYTFGSIGFEKESEILWKITENFFYEMNNVAKKNNINLVILISPISLLVDYHDHINHTNLSIDCATIDAHKRLIAILKKNNIDYIDPLDKFNSFAQSSFNEKNQLNLFHNFDTNHPNYNGSYLIALSILEYFKIK